MKTLIIYDNSGHIIFQGSGSVREPQGGVPFFWAEIPSKKLAESVDVTDEQNPVPILVDIPTSREEQRLKALEETTDCILLKMLEGGQDVL